jgi:predicted kinase
MPKVYMLIGVPGSGKSTWIANQDWAKDLPVVSSDRFIDKHAEEMGKTYNEVFDDYAKIAMRLMDNQARICHANNLDFIWDQTNTSAKSRKGKLAILPGYEAIAVMFRTPDADEHARRLAQRPGKQIPDNVMKSMIDNLQEPTVEEGFVDIWYV